MTANLSSRGPGPRRVSARHLDRSITRNGTLYANTGIFSGPLSDNIGSQVDRSIVAMEFNVKAASEKRSEILCGNEPIDRTYALHRSLPSSVFLQSGVVEVEQFEHSWAAGLVST